MSNALDPAPAHAWLGALALALLLTTAATRSRAAAPTPESPPASGAVATPTPAAAAPTAPRATSLEDTFRDALFQEEARRHFDRAIAGYETVIRALDEQRTLAATAVFRLGECYRKLGRTNDATAQYQRILRDFAAEETLVTLSRQNLGALGVGIPSPAAATAPAPDAPERERLATALARIQSLENDTIQQALTIQAFFPDDGLKRMLQRVPKLEAQVQKFRDNPAWKPDGIVYPVHASGDYLTDIGTQQHFTLAEAERILELQKSHIREHLGPILAIERARLQTLPSTPSKATGSPEDAFAGAQLRQDIVLLESQLASLKGKPHRELLSALPALFPADARGIAELRSRLSDLDLQAAAKETTLAPDHPEMKALAVQRKALDLRLQQEISDVMDALRTRLEALRLAADSLGNVPKVTPPTTADGARAQPAASGLTSEESEEIRRIEALVAHSPDLINAARGTQAPPLFLAASKGQLRVARYLLDHGAKPDWIFNSARPLHAATVGGHKSIVELLLDRGAAVDAPAGHAGQDARVDGQLVSNGSTALHLAAQSGFLGLAQLLLDRGAELNATDSRGTPLLAAVRGGRVEMVEFLLSKGADPNARAEGRFPPLSFASDRTLELLLDRKADPRLDFGYRLVQAAGSIPPVPATVKRLLDAGADPNAEPFLPEGFRDAIDNANFRKTPLLAAVTADDRSSADLLLAAKADPNGVSKYEGRAPIHWAVQGLKIDALSWLLNHRADPNLPDGRGLSALEILNLERPIAPGGPDDEPTMSLAVDHPPNVVSGPQAARVLPTPAIPGSSARQAPDALRWTAAVLLLRHGADPNRVPGRGGFPIAHKLAVWAGTNEFQEIHRAKADLTAAVHGLTPLMVAVANGNASGVGALLAAGVPVDATDESGNTALHHAAWAQDLALIRRLLEAGADKGRTNRLGDTPVSLVNGRRYSVDRRIALNVPALNKLHPEGVFNGTGVRDPELLRLLGVSSDSASPPSRVAAQGALLPTTVAGSPTLPVAMPLGFRPGGKAHVYGAMQRTVTIEANQRPMLSQVFLESTVPVTANLKAVRVHRAPAGTNTMGETITIDVQALLKTNDRSKDLEIRPGDRIEVPEKVL